MDLRKRGVAAVGAMLMFATVLQAQPVQRAETMAGIGRWQAFRVNEPKVSEPGCLAIYERDANVQIWPTGLFMRFHEPIDQVALAYGDAPFRGLRPTTAKERKFNSVWLVDDEFSELLDSNQLWVRVLTESKQKLSRTLETSGAREMHAYVVAGCPGKPVSPPPKGCEEGLEQTLRGQGRSETEIEALCGRPTA